MAMFSSESMDVERVARAGFKGSRQDKGVVISDRTNKFLVAAVKQMPRVWTPTSAMKTQPVVSDD